MGTNFLSMAQIAKELHVSKSSVYRAINKLNIKEDQTQGKKQLYNIESIKKIQAEVSDIVQNNPRNDFETSRETVHTNSRNDSELFKNYQQEIADWKKQAEKKDQQIDKLTSLLDQQQRLQMDVQQKLDRANKEINRLKSLPEHAESDKKDAEQKTTTETPRGGNRGATSPSKTNTVQKGEQQDSSPLKSPKSQKEFPAQREVSWWTRLFGRGK